MRPAPCVVCGRRRGHAEYHETYRREYRRAAHLLRPSWPRLRGLPPRRPAPEPAPEWHAQVLRSGEVVHRIVR